MFILEGLVAYILSIGCKGWSAVTCKGRVDLRHVIRKLRGMFIDPFIAVSSRYNMRQVRIGFTGPVKLLHLPWMLTQVVRRSVRLFDHCINYLSVSAAALFPCK